MRSCWCSATSRPTRPRLHKVGLVLVPVRPRAVACRLPEDLVEVQENRIADQRANGSHDLRMKRQGAVERAPVIHRAELEVLDLPGVSRAVPFGSDVSEPSVPLE